jgi:hypothetical protein
MENEKVGVALYSAKRDSKPSVLIRPCRCFRPATYYGEYPK